MFIMEAKNGLQTPGKNKFNSVQFVSAHLILYINEVHKSSYGWQPLSIGPF